MDLIIDDLQYTKTHEWVRDNGDGTYTIGITDHAQALLGDIVFVELPEVEMTINEGEDCAVVESVKAASDIYSPISGEITEINQVLNDEPEIINKSPYDEGWIFTVKADDAPQDLLDAETYRNLED